MTRKEFMNELAFRLRHLPHEDLQAVLQYYEEYFDEAGRAGEQAVMQELRSPAHVASRILSDYAVKGGAKNVRTATKNGCGWRAFWFTLLAICAAPVAVPLIIAAVITICALGFAGIAVVFALCIAAVVIFAKGVGLLFLGSVSGLMLFGGALILIGAAILVFAVVSKIISSIGKHIKNKSDK